MAEKKSLLILYLLLSFIEPLKAQQATCIFKDTLFRIDFGTINKVQEFNLNSLKNYTREYSNCPDDGYFSYSTATGDCFNGAWITIPTDHTPNDTEGKMLLVNASLRSSVFFIANLKGFKPNCNYEFGLWLMNLCRAVSRCPPLPPDIIISLETTKGKKLISFQTGLIVPNENPNWKKYSAFFTTPSDVDIVVLKMENKTNGGCGNDFAMDDITFRECYKKEKVIVPKELTMLPKKDMIPIVNMPKKPIKDAIPIKQTGIKDTIAVIKLPTKEKMEAPGKITRINSAGLSIPDVILSRKNPVIKKIETDPGELIVELYDNGQVDGDTVSIYHNNELIVSHAGLSEKPVQFKIKVDAHDPHHELIMVADNLGSIPPNTSLMIITTKGKRYEIFISSSEQQNAKLLIELKE